MDNITRAKINLFAILRNLEDLCEMDPQSKEIYHIFARKKANLEACLSDFIV